LFQFKPIRKTTISAEIIDQIASMVGTGRLKPGEKLPSERRLSELFNVGRSSIREALKALETIGITQRTRRGTIVSPNKRNYDVFFWSDLHSSTIHEVFETRKLMEIGLAGLAAWRATPQQIKEISETLVETKSTQEAIASDVAFHRALAKAAKNSVFSKIHDLVTGLLFQTHKYYSLLERNEDLEEFLATVFTQHKKILEAIEAHDPESARRAIKEHLEFTEKEMLGRMVGDYPKTEKLNMVPNWP